MFLTSYSSNLRPNKLENKINNTQLSNITNKKLILIKKNNRLASCFFQNARNLILLNQIIRQAQGKSIGLTAAQDFIYFFFLKCKTTV